VGIVRMGPPQELVTRLRDQFSANCFIETGTYLGGTAVWASDNFEKVVTIENSPEIYERTSGRYRDINNIEFMFGHTTEVLKKIVPSLRSPVIFWLDAHWCGGVTYGNTDECPLLEELEIVNRSDLQHSILIDDARLFTSPPPPPHDHSKWPNIASILETLNARPGRYTMIIDDIILSVPESARPLVEEYYMKSQAPLSPGASIKAGLKMIVDGFRSILSS
jgi:hypothetical protein